MALFKGAAPETVPEADIARDFHFEALREYEPDQPKEMRSVPGLKIHKLSLARITLFKEIDSPLVEGVSLADMGNYFEHVQVFLFIQSLGLLEATELCYGEGAKRAAFMGGMKIAARINSKSTNAVVNEVLAILNEDAETQVVAKEPPGSRSKGPKAPDKDEKNA